MTRKRGLFSIFLGLWLGVLLGLGILWLEAFAGKTLLGLLAEQVEESCNCRLTYDSVELSLFTLRARARNVAVQEDGQTRLLFKRIEGDFSLRKISNRIITLNELRLIDGYSVGVGPASATYKFIDHLSSPAPSGQDQPERWKLKLLKLKTSNSEFFENFSDFQIHGQGVSLLLARTPDNDFDLKPEIKSLRLINHPSSPGHPVMTSLGHPLSGRSLGSARASMHLTDEAIEFKNLILKLDHSFLAFIGQESLDGGQKLEGKIKFSLDSKSLDVPKDISFYLHGQGQVSGKLGVPSVDAGFNTLPDRPAKFDFIPRLPLRYDPLMGVLWLNAKPGAVSIDLLKIQGPPLEVTVQADRPLVWSNGELSGGLLLKSASLQGDGFELHDFSANAWMSGTLAAPRLKLQATSSRATLIGPGLILPNLGLEADLSGSHLTFALHSTQLLGGELQAGGHLNLAAPATLTDFTYSLKNLQLLSSSTAQAQPLLTLNSSGNLQGPLDISQLQGSAEVEAQVGNLPSQKLTARGELIDGRLSLKAADKNLLNLALEADLSNPGEPAALKVSLPNANLLTALVPSLGRSRACPILNLEANYSFLPSLPLNGTGSIGIADLAIGCGANQLHLAPKTTIKVNDGLLKLDHLPLAAQATTLTLSGSLGPKTGHRLHADGSVGLAALLPLASALDDLQGTALVNLDVQGALSHPQLNGEIKIKNASFDIEAASLSATNINGDVALKGQEAAIHTLSAKVNQGTFHAFGKLALDDFNSSYLESVFSEVNLNISQDLSASISGKSTLAANPNGVPKLSGEVEINSATLEKRIDWAEIARTIALTAFRAVNPIELDKPSSTSTYPLTLDLHLFAPRNLMLVSNLINAELSANLNISGTLDKPVLNGEMQTLSGWFGLRDRRFLISEGRVIFNPDRREPQLQITGESSIRTREGDNVLVMIEISGPVSAPRIRLTSDRGLTEKELLRLLTIQGDLTGQQSISTLGQDVQVDLLPFLSDESFLGLGGVIKQITSIDSVSLEPSFNSLRGTVEPTAIARKRLFDKFLLVGESTLGSTANEARAKIIYEFLPWLKFSLLAESLSTRETSAFGADATITALSDAARYIDIRVHGNSALNELSILDGLRINSTSRLSPNAVDALHGALKKLYATRGYFETKARIECRSYRPAPSYYCRRLEIDIDEGPSAHISDVQVVGDKLPADLAPSCLAPSKQKIATEAFAQECVQTLVSNIRGLGYISARIGYEWRDGEQPNTKVLEISLNRGLPTTFSFEGNHRFGASDFLDSINLYQRKQPFGRNTINILTENIDRMYRAAGYLFVSVKSSLEKDTNSEAQKWKISIVEGPQIEVSGIAFSGNQALTDKEIRKAIHKRNSSEAENFLHPDYAISEELEYNCAWLRSLYHATGYPDAKVNYELIADRSQQKVKIEYKIEEGPARLAPHLQIENWPMGVDLPKAPRSAARDQQEEYLQTLLDTLKAEGFLSAALATSLDSDEQTLHAHFLPGPRSHVGKINIEGNEHVSSATILENLTVQSGDPWSTAKIDASRRKLLRLGLFSKVNLRPTEGTLGQPIEGLTVIVEERPLTTLEFGGGINSEYGWHLFGVGTDRTFFADGRSLSARLDAYYDQAASAVSQGIASFTYADPALAGSDFGLVEDLRYQHLDQVTLPFDLDRVALTSYVHRSWDAGATTATLGHTYSLSNLNNVPLDARLSSLDHGHLALSFLSTALTYDQRDDFLNPSKGYILNLNSDLASKILGSQADYVNLSSHLGLLQPLPFLSRRFTLAWGLSAASAWTFGGTDFVPISQRYFLGGRTSVRGFSENSLGPRGVNGSVLGGDLSSYQNLELRYRLADAVAAHLFYDAGGLFLKDRNVDLRDVRTSFGVGLRYLSPIGPIGFDVGFPLDRQNGEDAFRFHFSIGANI